MDNFSQLIQDAFQYYDTNKEKFEKKIKQFKYFKIERKDNDVDDNYIYFFNKKQEQIFKSKYAIIGKYMRLSNTWIWAWAIPQLTKKEINVSKKILNYGFEITTDENINLKTALVSSRFRITNLTQLDFYLALSSYLSKLPLIFPVDTSVTTYDPSLKILKLAKDEELIDTHYIFLYDYVEY